MKLIGALFALAGLVCMSVGFFQHSLVLLFGGPIVMLMAIGVLNIGASVAKHGIRRKMGRRYF